MQNWHSIRTDGVDPYKEILQKRASKKLPEMISAQKVATKLKKVVQTDDKILDVGCGAGHYLLSLQKNISVPYMYTGVDLESEYIKVAKEVFAKQKEVSFQVENVYKLSFADRSFDIVMCNNVLYLVPTIAEPIRELIRVAKRFVIFRTLIGTRSFCIQEVWNEDWTPGCGIKTEDEFDENGVPRGFNPFHIYSIGYIQSVVKKAAAARLLKCDIVPDNSVSNLTSTKEEASLPNATKVMGEYQVNEYIIQPWKFAQITLKE